MTNHNDAIREMIQALPEKRFFGEREVFLKADWLGMPVGAARQLVLSLTGPNGAPTAEVNGINSGNERIEWCAELLIDHGDDGGEGYVELDLHTHKGWRYMNALPGKPLRVFTEQPDGGYMEECLDIRGER
jgi:hypothetical protein